MAEDYAGNSIDGGPMLRPRPSASSPGLQAAEPRMRNRFPPKGILTIGAIVLIVVLLLVVIVGILM
ncbi:hypothetical protein ACWEQV_03150 [Rhodococcus aetherivorans]|uniref:hypothetical protein n=1 Tax=Rhodococcus aetherivorans TaxID=191292 RepID=UPI0011874392|nr:hypothetical protein [Rhodococcus aetherivorans]WFS15490.1 hypothetical protein P9K37_10795 [Rhodococcus aetherivorans]